MIDLILIHLLDNHFMICNQNEKYLLRFISLQNNNLDSSKNELLDMLCNLGVKLKFQDSNPVYQIIDELIYGY